jgi:integrase
MNHLDRQARTLLDAAGGDRLEALYNLAVTTGMRQGELPGLGWEDVDLKGRAWQRPVTTHLLSQCCETLAEALFGCRH